MSSSPATISSEPDAGLQTDFAQPFRILLLNEFARSRDAIKRAFLAANSAVDRSIAARVTDELMGVALLVRFIRQHEAESIPSVESFFEQGEI